MKHPDSEVQAALVHLSDALCRWERATSRQSALILREEYGFVYRAISGKPLEKVDDGVTDAQLLALIYLAEVAKIG